MHVSRLTGERVTSKKYKDGSTATVRDENFLTLANSRPNDPKDRKGRVEFGLRHKPQLRHAQKSVADCRLSRQTPMLRKWRHRMSHWLKVVPRCLLTRRSWIDK